MRKLFNIFICVIFCFVLSFNIFADSLAFEQDSPENFVVYIEEVDDACEVTEIAYSDSDLNIIANIVNGEVGGIIGNVTLTYYDGSVVTDNACILHKIHAQIVDNQVNSDMFPSTVYKCANKCWSSAYAKTVERSSSQWKHCKADVIDALSSDGRIPNNVFAATCDSKFAQKYSGYHLYAKVNWNTGWTKGTFYYYYYGELQEDDEEYNSSLDIIDCVNNIREYLLSLKSYKDLESIKCLGKNG